MKTRVLTVLAGTLLLATQSVAQDRPVTGKVTREGDVPMVAVSVIIKGTNLSTQTNNSGDYTIRVRTGQVLQYRSIGYGLIERTIGNESVYNVALVKNVTNLDAMQVTALGQQTTVRSLGTSSQMVMGSDVAQTGRENFINGMQGRVAGVEVTSSSGVPGASSSITIRGVSSISSSNQPLMIIDGLPLDNKTQNTNVFDTPGSATAFNNRGVDFTNRSADVNPEDIESMVVLKGPEAAALYGIDAANGAIVITTKRGRSGGPTLEYSNNVRMEQTRGEPALQNVYGPTTSTGDLLGTFAYFGAPYAAGTQFYDNIGGFFRTGVSQKHNIAFSGGTPDSKINYRIAVGGDKQQGVVINSNYSRFNLTGATQAQVTDWIRSDVSLQFSQANNRQAFTGLTGPLIGLLVWPQNDDAQDYLTPSGNRRRKTLLAAATEVDNPYFNVNKNRNTTKNGRLIANLTLTFTPFSWSSLKTSVGSDNYTTETQIVRHPESAAGAGFAGGLGVLNVADDITKNINAVTLLNFNRRSLTRSIGLTGFTGGEVRDSKSLVNGLSGQDFLDPNFVSINNTSLRLNRTTVAQRRLMSAYASATVDFKDYLFVTVAGRNDWTSTIPRESNSFFYPSINGSFVFSDAFPAVARVVTGKVRAAYAQVGKDARPYAYRPSLEFKTTSNGGYGYGFTGPNLALKPEFASSYEFGTELGFFDNRVGLDVTTYRKQTKDQIVNDIRGSYASGFILFNLNGAVTRNEGWEVTLRGTPKQTRSFSWDFLANFDRSRGRTLELPNALPESYVSDTWLFGNVRNGTAPGQSTRSLTGQFYLRNNEGKLLIDPTTGLPLRNTLFVAGPGEGYDRQPDFTLGLTNTFRYKALSLNFLLDFRRGGDVFNATEHYLTSRGLSERTLDRERPRVLDGVLRDGKENSTAPTPNNIVVIPAQNATYYVGISEELFIEKDINWVRLRDVTLRVNLPGRMLRARNASAFLTGTDLFLFTNYSGLDPIVNGNTAAVGGSGAVGIDFGNFPMPRGVAFGLRVGY
ncbi:MAG: SusC/RagA family TonB-linked outer membrane protein [Phycisphaerae bacterium]|nr:SusC/RagA family TonB-linked outer membrane protein [Gemmatimonadaceae bacterium]